MNFELKILNIFILRLHKKNHKQLNPTSHLTFLWLKRPILFNLWQNNHEIKYNTPDKTHTLLRNEHLSYETSPSISVCEEAAICIVRILMFAY